jgi:hypothetical protein
MVVYTPLKIEIKEIDMMSFIAITCTFIGYSFYFIEAFKAYKKGVIEERPRGRKIKV